MENRWSNKAEESKVCAVRRKPDAAGHLLFWLPAVAGAGADLWSKGAAFSFLKTQPFGQMEVVKGFLNLTMVENPGAAFSIARGQKGLLTGISIAALVIIVVAFLIGTARRRLSQAGFGLMAAGIAGNLYDRLFNDGYVRDFIDVYVGSYHWPTFNVADSLLCIGVALLIWANFTPKAGQTRNHPHTKEC